MTQQTYTTLHRTLQNAADGQGEPTLVHYAEFQRAFTFFNDRLFRDHLDLVPDCLIVMTRKPKSHGYLAHNRWANAETGGLVHVNPLDFIERSAEEVLSTLVHEMAHAWQVAHGEKVPRVGYHNREWAEAMAEVGLIPTATGQEGGKQTGQRMTHLIEEGGAFARQAALLLDIGWTIPHIDIPEEKKERKNNRPKYICPKCAIQAWGKSGLNLRCEECEQRMEEEKPEDEEPQAEEGPG